MKFIFATLSVGLMLGGNSQAANQPNILFILTEDNSNQLSFNDTNLVNWLLLQQFNSPAPPIPFVDLSATNFNQYFYRI